MSHLIEYVRKPGKITSYKIEKNEDTGELELFPVYDRGEPYGCFYARKFHGVDGYFIGIGWSLCCKRDNFSKDDAVAIASDRLMGTHFGDQMVIPHSLEKKFIKFCERAKKFYQTGRFAHEYIVVKEVKLDV